MSPRPWGQRGSALQGALHASADKRTSFPFCQRKGLRELAPVLRSELRLHCPARCSHCVQGQRGPAGRAAKDLPSLPPAWARGRGGHGQPGFCLCLLMDRLGGSRATCTGTDAGAWAAEPAPRVASYGRRPLWWLRTGGPATPGVQTWLQSPRAGVGPPLNKPKLDIAGGFGTRKQPSVTLCSLL